MNILITLTTAGANTGPTFLLYSNMDSFTNPFESGVSKAALVAGYYTSNAPDGTTIVRVTSVGPNCSNYVDLPVAVITTTTTTTTPATTTTTTTVIEPTTTTTTTVVGQTTTTTTTVIEPTTTTTTTPIPATTTTTTTALPTTTTTTTALVYKPFAAAAGSGTLAAVCPSDTYPVTLYFTGAGTYPTVDDTVYTLASAIYTPFAFNGDWIKIGNSHAISGYGASGVVTFDNTCAAPSQSYWYRAENCTTQQDIFSIEYTQPTFRIGDRITYGLGTFVVAQISETSLSGSEFAFVNTGLTGCPEVTTTSTTSTTTTTIVPMWTGYNLIPVTFGTCDSAGPNITAYKYYDDGSIINGDTLYATQDLNDKLATGYYADGGYRYEVNTGTVSNKTACAEPTTTTTTTPIPTTTTTTTPSPTTTTTTTVLACYSCNDTQEVVSTLDMNSGSYPSREVCSTSSTCFIFNWTVQERPNVFRVGDANGEIWNSGWVGYANWSGPWLTQGPLPLNTLLSGSSPILQFTSTEGRYVVIQYGNADPNNQVGDSALWGLTCATCPTTTTTTTPVPPTTTTTTTQTPTTTTTTTFPPVDFTYTTSCAGGEGTGVITITGMSGGNGVNYEYSIQPTPGTWFPYPSTNQLTGLANSTYNVAARAQSGPGTNKSIGISCLNPPTTTTTTTAPPTKIRYFLYDVDANCNQSNGRTAWSYQSVSGGQYYTINGVSLFYIITSSHSDDSNYISNIAESSCVVPTTTSTTTSTTTMAPIVSSLKECGAQGPATNYTNVVASVGNTYYIQGLCYIVVGRVTQGNLTFVGDNGTVNGCSC